jgi:hypothetical protein
MQKIYKCVFLALEASIPLKYIEYSWKMESLFHEKLALATAAVLALLSVAANAQVGKGKAPPPPPVVTKG